MLFGDDSKNHSKQEYKHHIEQHKDGQIFKNLPKHCCHVTVIVENPHEIVCLNDLLNHNNGH